MSAKLTKYTRHTVCKVENKKFYVKYFDDKWYSTNIDIDYDFEEDNNPYYDYKILAKLKSNNKILVIRYDSTFSIYRESDKMLLDIGTIDLSKLGWTEHYYKPIGFKANNSKATTIYLDVTTNDFAFEYHEGLNKPLSVYKVLKDIPNDIDLTLSYSEAYKNISIVTKGDIYLYSCKQRYDWREYLYEVSSTI